MRGEFRLGYQKILDNPKDTWYNIPRKAMINVADEQTPEGKKKKPILTQETVMKALDWSYDKSLVGLPKAKSCYELAEEYLKHHEKIEDDNERVIKNAKEFIKWQITKCTATGFVTGLGGIITIPVTLPADLVTVWYVQLRMIATLAVMGGFDPKEDCVRSLAYVCLTGSSANKILKEAGIQIANKATMAAIKRIPGKVLISINKKVGFRLVTKFGTKGVINLGKCVPVVGGIVSGGLDFAETKVIASKAFKTFIIGTTEGDGNIQSA